MGVGWPWVCVCVSRTGCAARVPLRGLSGCVWSGEECCAGSSLPLAAVRPRNCAALPVWARRPRSCVAASLRRTILLANGPPPTRGKQPSPYNVCGPRGPERRSPFNVYGPRGPGSATPTAFWGPGGGGVKQKTPSAFWGPGTQTGNPYCVSGPPAGGGGPATPVALSGTGGEHATLPRFWGPQKSDPCNVSGTRKRKQATPLAFSGPGGRKMRPPPRFLALWVLSGDSLGALWPLWGSLGALWRLAERSGLYRGSLGALWAP